MLSLKYFKASSFFPCSFRKHASTCIGSALSLSDCCALLSNSSTAFAVSSSTALSPSIPSSSSRHPKICSANAQHAEQCLSATDASPFFICSSNKSNPFFVHAVAAFPSSNNCPRYINFSYPLSGFAFAASLNASSASSWSPYSANAYAYVSNASTFVEFFLQISFNSNKPCSMRSYEMCVNADSICVSNAPRVVELLPFVFLFVALSPLIPPFIPVFL